MSKLLNIISLIWLCVAVQAKASAQEPELLLFDGYVLPVHDYPLEMYPGGIPPLNRYANLSSSDNAREYRAVWLVRDAHLYLVGIEAFSKGQPVRLQDLFGKRVESGMVLADWFTGTISWPGTTWPSGLPEGRRATVDKARLVLRVKSGQVELVRQQMSGESAVHGAFNE